MEVSVDFGAHEAAKASVADVSKALGENLSSLRARLGRIQWEGEDRIAYQQHMNDWDSAVEALNQLLGQISVKMEESRLQYGGAISRNVQRWGG